MCPFISVTIQVDRQVIGIIIMFIKTLLYINAIETVAVVSYLLAATVALARHARVADVSVASPPTSSFCCLCLKVNL